MSLTDAERNWLLTAATNRPIFAAYQEQVERGSRARRDERQAAALVTTLRVQPDEARRRQAS